MFKHRKCLGEDQILIFDLLTGLLKESGTLEISEGQLMVLLSHLLAVSYDYQYRAELNCSRSGNFGGIFHWSETIHHLLRTYATEQAITEALEEFHNIHQNDNENETTCAARIGNAAYHCGNFHDEGDKIYLCVTGVLPALTTMLSSP